MRFKDYHTYTRRPVNFANYITYSLLFLLLMKGLWSCRKFVEVDLPGSQLTGPAVFDSKGTVNAAMTSIYAKFRDARMLTGLPAGLSAQLGSYADELVFYGNSSHGNSFFYNNSIVPSNSDVSNLWNFSYNQIYSANAMIEGLAASDKLPADFKNQLKGEALFVRSLVHFYLTYLFGDIPVVTTTHYLTNQSIGKQSAKQVNLQVITDLQQAIDLLPADYSSVDRVRPNKAVAMALLARVYLYQRQWGEAASLSTSLIEDNRFVWESDLNKVFLKDSRTTLWQFSPSLPGKNTNEGSSFIFLSGPPPFVALEPSLVAAFETGDSRKTAWIREVSNGTSSWYHSYKYKLNNSTASSQENSVIFRIAEQYLIRAEARTHLTDFEGARSDLNKVRHRAGLSDVAANTKDALLQAIQHERKVELFTEFGHRFFDLKRTGQLDHALGTLKIGWNSTDSLLPLPERELMANPSLLPQNPGY